MVMAIQENDTTIIFPMNEAQARNITREIKGHLREARSQILEFYRAKGWLVMGYANFKEWAIGEFEVSWQQVYYILNAAEVDENLTTLSPQGESFFIPVKHATALGKLKKPEAQYRAYTLAVEQAKAQGGDAPTEKIVTDAVNTLLAEETTMDSPYPVVRQMLAASEITALQAEQIVFELDRLRDEPAQGFVQSYMAKYGLKHPELIYPIGHKFLNERQRGKRSYVLDEIDRTGGYLGNTYLSKAGPKDLARANKEQEEQHIAEGVAKKQAEMRAAGIPIEEQFALNLWRNAPVKSARELIKLLPPKDLEAVFNLLAQKLGYVISESGASLLEDDMIGVQTRLYRAGTFEKVAENQAMELMVRVKPEEEKKEDA